MPSYRIDEKTRAIRIVNHGGIAVENAADAIRKKEKDEHAREVFLEHYDFNEIDNILGEIFIIDAPFTIDKSGKIIFDADDSVTKSANKTFLKGMDRAKNVANFAYDLGASSARTKSDIPDKYLTFEERIIKYFDFLNLDDNVKENILKNAREMIIKKMFEDIKRRLISCGIDYENAFLEGVKNNHVSDIDGSSLDKLYNGVLSQYVVSQSAKDENNNFDLLSVINSQISSEVLNNFDKHSYLFFIENILSVYRKYGLNLSEDEYLRVISPLIKKYNGSHFDNDVFYYIVNSVTKSTSYEYDPDEIEKFRRKLYYMPNQHEDRYRKFFDLGYASVKSLKK